MDVFLKGVEEAGGDTNMRNAVAVAIGLTIAAVSLTVAMVFAFENFGPGAQSRVPGKLFMTGSIVTFLAWGGMVVAWANIGAVRRRKRHYQTAARLRDDPEMYAAMLAALRDLPNSGSTDETGRRMSASDARKLRYQEMNRYHVPPWLQPALLKAADNPRDGESPHDVTAVIRRNMPD